jgi:hypothetical protein
MALNEKKIADAIVGWREQQRLGQDFVPVADAIDIAVTGLEGLQDARALVARMADLVEAATVK